MTRPFVLLTLAVLLGTVAYALGRQAATDWPAPGLKHRVVLEQILKEKLDGKDTRVTVWELECVPGSGSAPHRHPGLVLGYVLDRQLEVQIEGQPLKVYHKGEMWYEPARVLHQVSRNPSKTHSARFLAIMFSDKDDKQLVLPASP